MTDSPDSSAPTSRRSSSSAAAPANGGGKTGGWFHSIKKAVSGAAGSHGSGSAHAATSDPEFDLARENFVKLSESSVRIREHMHSYLQHCYGLFTAANAATIELSSQLEGDAGTGGSVSHPYSQLQLEARRAHAMLVGDRESAIAAQLAQRCIASLDKEIELHAELHKRIAVRNQMLSELEYYVAKVDSLKKERDARMAKGKEEKPADADKFERNLRKMEDSKTQFASYNGGVVVDMATAHRNRVLLLGPVLMEFISVEREFAHLYTGALQGIAEVDADKAAESSARIRSSSIDAANAHMNNLPTPVRNASIATASAARTTRQPSGSNISLAQSPPALPPKQHELQQVGQLPQAGGAPQPPADLPPSHLYPSSGVNPLSSVNDIGLQKQVEAGRGVSVKDAAVSIDANAAGAVEPPNPFESEMEAERRNQAVFSPPAHV